MLMGDDSDEGLPYRWTAALGLLYSCTFLRQLLFSHLPFISFGLPHVLSLSSLQFTAHKLNPPGYL